MVQIIRITRNTLFNQGILSDVLDSKRYQLKGVIESYQKDFISKIDESELIKDLFQKFSINPIILNEKTITRSKLIDIKVDVSRGRDTIRGRPITIRGKSIIISIPYEGNVILFNLRASNLFPCGFSKAEVGQSEIRITYEIHSYDDNTKQEAADLINRTFKNDLHMIKRDLIHINNEVKSYNSSLEKLIKENLKIRKKELSIDSDLEELIKFPLKQRQKIPEPVNLSIKRKPIKLKQKDSSIADKEAIEKLALKDYSKIINTIKLMALVMEQSPEAIKDMQEEDLRWLFLIVLNGSYEGLATGETFNYYGKTDIIIKWKGKNLFICECKFWKGKEGFLETIDQLQKYITWRDTKTAIIIFNKNKVFTDVLTKIKNYMKEHNCFEKFLGTEEETIFRYEFHHKKDKERKFLLTIMAFDIPKEVA